MSNVFLGQKAGSLTSAPKGSPVSKVVLVVDDSNYFEAGTGDVVLEVTCPYGSQEMANNILSALSGYSYQPALAGDALLDPAAEFGDALTVNGLYTTIASMDITFDGLMTSDVGAPGEQEIENEYPYESQQTAEINRRLADTRALISKTSEEILLQVEGISEELSGQIASISTKLDSITLTVSNGSTSSTIQLKAGSTVISSQEIEMSGLVTFTGLANGTTTINGACIKTGTIDADRLNLTGAITFGDLSSSVQSDINSAQSTANSAQSTANSAWNVALSAQSTAQSAESKIDNVSYTYGGTTYIDGTKIMTGTVTASSLEAGSVSLLDGSGMTAGTIGLEGASSYFGRKVTINSGAIELSASAGDVFIQSGNGAFLTLTNYLSLSGDIAPTGSGSYSCGMSNHLWSDVYAANSTIQTSDANLKNSIEALPDKYLTMMEAVQPVRYKLNDGTSGRYHIGFIAQDVEEAMTAAGVTSQEFGGFVKAVDEDGRNIYMLRYSEFIGILWAEILLLKNQIRELTAA